MRSVRRQGVSTMQGIRRAVEQWRAAWMASGDASETQLSNYFEEYVENGKPGIPHILSRPANSVAALIAIHKRPRLVVPLPSTPEGEAVRRSLTRRSVLGQTVVHSATSVLVLPDRQGVYEEGAAKQTLRRKARKALARGVHWKPVSDSAERRVLLDLANDSERNHPLQEYREPNPDNDDLLDYAVWLAAYADDGRPLLLSVTPVDDEWAVLRYFRTLGGGEEHSNARYLMTQVLVDHLVGLGVRYLADASSPVGLPNGLRHFQRMLGFRIYRVMIASSEPGGPAGVLRRIRQKLPLRVASSVD